MRLNFTLDDAQRAYDEWGSNCGPGAIAAISGMSLEQLRPYLGDFEKKYYTNPTLMFEILDRIKISYEKISPCWPAFGLVRVQWEGPWTREGVPIVARYRHTHWVGSYLTKQQHLIFDINAMSVGGWVDFKTWKTSLVPWLLKECEPKADGKWHLTHTIKIKGDTHARMST